MKKIIYPNAVECRKRRIALGYSQYDLARLCRRDQSVFSKFEAGKQLMNFEDYFSMLSALEYEVAFKKGVINGKEDSDIQPSAAS